MSRSTARTVDHGTSQASPVIGVVSDVAVGERLRKARMVRDLSLKAVEAATHGEIGAAALSSYERGEHAITAKRLYELALLYEVPVAHFIDPLHANDSEPRVELVPRQKPLRLDLGSLEQARSKEARMVRKLVTEIQGWRAPQTRASIEVRREDLVTTAALLGESVESLIEVLSASGVLRRPRGRPSMPS